MVKSKPLVSPTLLDKAYMYFSPTYGLKRLQAKAQYAMLSNNGYVGADTTSRAMKGWNVSNGDTDANDTKSAPQLRIYSRDLYRNNGLATGAIDTISINVVGSGLKLQSQIDNELLNMTQDEANAWQKKTEREFHLWASRKEADAARKLNFYEMQGVAFLSMLMSGDSFVLLPYIKRQTTPYKLSLQLIEADRINNKDSQADTTELAGGIKTNKYGEPIEYHISLGHPASITYDVNKYKWTVVPAFGKKSGRKNVIHLFEIKRPNQRRGIPILAPVIQSLKQVGRYTDAELMASVISGMFTVFIKSESGELDDGLPQDQKISDIENDYELGNGAIVGLGEGESIETANPSRVNAAFDPFVTAILRQVGAGLQVPYELLIKHFTASYSASRAALLEAWKSFKIRRTFVATNFCQPIYEEFLIEAINLGRIKADGFFQDPMIRQAYCGATWNGAAQGQLNPVNETTASINKIHAGLSTREREAVEMNGSDFQNNVVRAKKETELMKDSGLLEIQNATINNSNKK